MVKIIINAGQLAVGESDRFCHDKVIHALIKKLRTYKDVEVLRTDELSKIQTERINKWQADVYVSITYSKAEQPNVNSFEIITPVKILIDKGRKKPINIHIIKETKPHKEYLQVEGEVIADELAILMELKPLPKQTLTDAATIILQHLEASRKGVIPKKWLKEIQEDTLTDSNAIGLLYVVIHRWLVD